MPNFERKSIERILRKARKSRDPSRRADADELIEDVDLTVPMNAPERDTVKVLGSPEDERSVNGGYEHGDTEGEGFTGRHAGRVNAGPENLRQGVVSEVAADDPRVQKQDFSYGAPEPSAPTRISAANKAMFDYDKAQSWGGPDGLYNYYYNPNPGGGVGVLEIEGPNGYKATINPRAASGQTESQKKAWLAIMDERFKMGEPLPTNTIQADPERAESDGVAEPSAGPAPEDEYGQPLDSESAPDTGTSEPEEEDIYAGAEQSPVDTPAETPAEPRQDMPARSAEAKDTGDRPSGDVGGRLFDALASFHLPDTSREATRASQQAHQDRMEASSASKRREAAETTAYLPDRPEGDIGGRLADTIQYGTRSPEDEAAVLREDLYRQLGLGGEN